jgi:hypothetical protein
MRKQRPITSVWIQRAELCNLKQTASNADRLQAESHLSLSLEKPNIRMTFGKRVNLKVKNHK